MLGLEAFLMLFWVEWVLQRLALGRVVRVQAA